MTENEPKPRYEPLRKLGHGATGAVWLTRDCSSGQEVALKRLHWPSPDALLRLKRQFRAIAPLSHPGLVKLFALDQDRHGVFFTMEVVEGRDLAHQLKDRLGATDRTQRAQLALHLAHTLLPALLHLHEHGITHCDIKPANLMLKADGAAKLLDFGASAILRDDVSHGASERRMGTPRYMCPERLRGGSVHPAWDMYALGITLLEIAADRSPFTKAVPVFDLDVAQSCDVLASLESTSALLGRLCRGLLRTDPEQRLSASAALGVLSRPVVSVPAVALRHHTPKLVGRESVQRWLASRTVQCSELFKLTVLEGPGGCGKSSVLRWFAKEQRGIGALVLRGHGRPEEHLRYNVLDGAVDDLAELLLATPYDPELAADLDVASQAFPVLGRRHSSKGQANRQQVFDGLIRVLASLATLDGLYILIDDLHWADSDSIAFLRRLCEVAPTGVNLLASLRTDVGSTAAHYWLDGMQGVARRELTRLLHRDISFIIESTTRRLGMVADPDTLASLVPNCAGLPLLAELAAVAVTHPRAHAAVELDEPYAQLMELVRTASAAGHELVAVLLVADRALPIAELQAISGAPPDGLVAELAALERLGLVRRTVAADGSPKVAIYHDLLRAAAYRVLNGADIERAHALSAKWLQNCSLPDPLRLVRHLLSAKRPQAAAEQALAAAELAERDLAYGSAADLYGIAIEHLGRDRPRLLRARAEALTRTGRHGEAVRCWQELAEASPEDRCEALLNEAASRLAGNEILEGYLMLDRVMQQLGLRVLRYEKVGAVFEWLRFVAGPLFRPTRRFVQPSQRDLATLRTLIHLSENMTYFDPIAGLRVMQHARRRAYQIGSATAAARCEYGLAFVAAYSDGSRGPTRLGSRYVAAARRCRRGNPEAPELVAIDAAFRGMNRIRSGEWSNARRELDSALATLVASGHAGSWIHLFFLGRRYEISAYEQDFPDARRVWCRFEELVRERRDSNLNLQYLFGKCTLNAFTGHIDLLELEELRASWPDEVPTIQKMLIDYYAALPDLNTGSGRLAWRALSELGSTHWRFRPWHGIYRGMFAAARAVSEVNALRSGDAAASAQRVRRLAAIARRAPPILTARAERALAYLADAQHEPEDAIAQLHVARAQAHTANQQLDVAIADYQLGQRLGGDEGNRRVQSAFALVALIGASSACLYEDIAWR